MRRWIVRLLVILGIVAVGLALRATVFAPKPIEVDEADEPSVDDEPWSHR